MRKPRTAIRLSNRGFTVIELLVVMSIIILLIAMLLPALRQGRESGRTAVCLSQVRQFMAGWSSYTDDSQGRLMGAHTWQLDYDWVYTPPAPPHIETEQNLIEGMMYTQVNDLTIYKCPTDPRETYLRTYSMNNYFSGTSNWHIRPIFRMGEVRRPSNQMVMLEEPDPRGYNWGSWVIYPQGHPNQNNWIDWPASYHNGGNSLGFADGHSEHWRWEDNRTIELSWFNASTPDNPDLQRLQQVYSPPQ